MKRYIVIECDTNYYSAFVHEAKIIGERTIELPSMAGAIFNAVPSPKFYGTLAQLLVTKESIENAEPITPETEEPCTTAI